MEPFEKYWNRLRPQRGTEKPKPAEGKGWDLRQALLRAAVKAEKDLAGHFDGLDPVVVSRVATTSIRCFLEAWYDELHQGGDTVSLIGVVLAGKDMTVDELKGFVQALPATLIERICLFPSPKASGLQALLAMENHRRKGEIPDYALSRDPTDGTLVVSFRPAGVLGALISFKLDETFEGVPQPGVIST